VTGVTLLMSGKEMDAGPIVSQLSYDLSGDEQAKELLDILFALGAAKLVECFQKWQPILSEMKSIETTPQSSFGIVTAPKVSAQDSFVDWSNGAQAIHNQVRALSIWPGTKCVLDLGGEAQEVKLLRTRILAQNDDEDVVRDSLRSQFFQVTNVQVAKQGTDICLRVSFNSGPALDVLELQPAGKRAMVVRDFANSLAGKSLSIWQEPKKMEQP
jgi:methionyl-tRNA formyltransferase